MSNSYHEYGYPQRERVAIPVPKPIRAENGGSFSSATPVGHGLACPVSKAYASTSPSGSGCPMSSHSTSPSRRMNRESAMSVSPYGHTRNISGNDDITCPFQLPDVSADKNPLYEEYDEDLIYTDLRERVRYLLTFVNFTERDVEALNDFQPILLPMVPELVDNVYHQLFRFDVTKNMFMPRTGGHEGMMLSDLHHLALDAPQIETRKKTFSVYMRKLVTSDYDDFATWQYFDHVGIMHTGQNELKHRKLMGKPPLFVDLMHLALTLAWTLDVLTPVILSYTEYPLSRRIDIMRAFQKVTWIQNDLFTRHYAVRSTEVAGLNQIRQQHDLSSSENVASLANRNSGFYPTSTVNSAGSGSSFGNTNAEVFNMTFPVESNHKDEEKKQSKRGNWYRF
ncbi:hypothetical protein D9611_001257 [Ephemerocybe angulata]|uniref:Globin-sensor domain-containing protein n=1 Tax=Ephemerocybe angulata TaxID=980116 RepID=A0A8H5CHS7_9AGAR|nr:hypothetical protein D9611_001257 [Tulosesus angulatus]